MADSAERTAGMRVKAVPNVLTRLVSYFGSKYALAKQLEVDKTNVRRWSQDGFIGEVWALDIHDLRVKDGYGTITAMTVLLEAREGRIRRAEERSSS